MGGFGPAQGEEVLAKFWGKSKKERGEKDEWQEAPEVEGAGQRKDTQASRAIGQTERTL